MVKQYFPTVPQQDTLSRSHRCRRRQSSASSSGRALPARHPAAKTCADQSTAFPAVGQHGTCVQLCHADSTDDFNRSRTASRRRDKARARRSNKRTGLGVLEAGRSHSATRLPLLPPEPPAAYDGPACGMAMRGSVVGTGSQQQALQRRFCFRQHPHPIAHLHWTQLRAAVWICVGVLGSSCETAAALCISACHRWAWALPSVGAPAWTGGSPAQRRWRA